MPVTTHDRRAFFLGKRPAPPPDGQVRSTFLGQDKDPFRVANQELPEVPAPDTLFTFNSGLTPYTGTWGRTQAAHLLRRTCFGVKKDQLDALAALDLDAAVAQILSDQPTPPPPVNNYNGPEIVDPVVPLGETWITQPLDFEYEGYRIVSWRGWWYDLMLTQPASIVERMTMFWHNHFATQTEIVYWGRMAYQLNSKLRAKATGNFKSLVKDVTLDTMMLFFLNNVLNSKEAPDENFARELQELFTIGKDNPDHYTEEDVVAAARVLTGWRVNWNDPLTYNTFFSGGEHDFEDKQFSAFYGNTVIQGSPFGEQELDALLDMIFAKNEVSEYICRKIYRWLVYYNIDAATEQNVIKPMAELFRNSNYEIKPVLEALLKSEHFYEAAQSGCFIKTPLDIALGTMSTYNTTFPAGTTPWDNFVFKAITTYYLSEMKMLPGDPPNVAGWQAFRQTPQYYRVWINGDTLRLRNLFTDVMTAYYFETDNDRIYFDLLAFTASLSNPGDPNALINEVTELLMPQPLSAAKKYLLKTILLSGLASDSYWTNAWDDYINNPTDPMATEVVQSRLRIFHLYLTRLPEFQLA